MTNIPIFFLSPLLVLFVVSFYLIPFHVLHDMSKIFAWNSNNATFRQRSSFDIIQDNGKHIVFENLQRMFFIWKRTFFVECIAQVGEILYPFQNLSAYIKMFVSIWIFTNDQYFCFSDIQSLPYIIGYL